MPIVTGIASNTNVTKRVSISELRLKLGTNPPAGGRTVTSIPTYLTNNARFNVRDWGAFGDGATDDRAKFATVDTAAQVQVASLYVPAGSFRIASNLTITSPVVMDTGAILKLDAGVTVTFSAFLDADITRHFDTSANYGSTFIVMVANGVTYPEWWGAKGDDTQDDSDMFIAASTTSQLGYMQLQNKTYKMGKPIPVYGGMRGVNTRTSHSSYEGGTTLHGVHTGDAIIDLYALQGKVIESVALYGDSITTPKTALRLGRSSPSLSSGYHRIIDLNVLGFYSKAGVYTIASEDNYWENVRIDVQGGAALYALAIAEKEFIGGFTTTPVAGSNMGNHFTSLRASIHINNANAAGLIISHTDSTGPTGNIVFDYPFISAGYGAHVQIDVPGSSDIDWPIMFNGGYGEANTAADGFKITGAAGRIIQGLFINGTRFALPAATKFFNQSANVTLKGGYIKTAAQLQTSVFQQDKLINNPVDIGTNSSTLSQIVATTLHSVAPGAGATYFAAPGDPVIDPTEALRQVVMPRPTIIRNLNLLLTSPQPASGNMVVTVRKNGVDTALTLTVPLSGGAILYQDINPAHYVSCVAGDAISIKFVNNAAAASGALGSVSLTYDLQVAP